MRRRCTSGTASCEPLLSDATGAWRRLDGDRLRSMPLACACCGRPVIGTAWHADIRGEARDFCEPRCETLYVDYWLPRHGRPAS